jgi:hypothetical protein
MTLNGGFDLKRILRACSAVSGSRVWIRRDYERSGFLGDSRRQLRPGPQSVLQIRTQDLLSDAAVNFVATAIEAFRPDIDAGALLSIDETETRVRMLPLRRSQEPS